MHRSGTSAPGGSQIVGRVFAGVKVSGSGVHGVGSRVSGFREVAGMNRDGQGRHSDNQRIWRQRHAQRHR